MTVALRKSKQLQLLALLLLVWLLMVALAGCSAESAASASLSARGAALIQTSTTIIRQFTLLTSSQLPTISASAGSELWADHDE